MKSILSLFAFLSLFGSSTIYAADPVDALEIYPLELRQAMLEALKYPKVLVGLNEQQKKSSAEFKAYLHSLPPATRQAVIKLAPFPNMVHALNELGAKNPKGVQTVMQNFPKELQPTAKDLMTNHPDVLARLDQLDDEPQKNYGVLTQSLPMQGKTAYLKLLRHPDTLQNLALALELQSATIESYEKTPQVVDDKAFALAQRLRKADNPPPPKLAGAPGDDPTALAALQKQADEINQTLSYEMNVNPKPSGAAEASVSFTPYPFYSTGLGGFVMPYWFGFGAWL